MSANAETLERQAAKLIPELWSLSLNKKLDKSGVGMKIVNKIYEKDIKNYGDTVHIGEIGDVKCLSFSWFTDKYQSFVVGRFVIGSV